MLSTEQRSSWKSINGCLSVKTGFCLYNHKQENRIHHKGRLTYKQQPLITLQLKLTPPPKKKWWERFAYYVRVKRMAMLSIWQIWASAEGLHISIALWNHVHRIYTKFYISNMLCFQNWVYEYKYKHQFSGRKYRSMQKAVSVHTAIPRWITSNWFSHKELQSIL